MTLSLAALASAGVTDALTANLRATARDERAAVPSVRAALSAGWAHTGQAESLTRALHEFADDTGFR